MIHLTWFSGDEFPPEIKKCVDSWKKVLPDFEIRLWTKEDALKTNIQYVADAIEAKKWAFASDVIRLYALYQYGGVYMDADIYLVERFDAFFYNRVTLFQEYHANSNVESQIDSNGNRTVDCVNGCGIQAAFLIAEKQNPYIKQLLEYYSDKRFILDSSGKVRKNELISPSIYAIASEQYGYIYKDVMQKLSIGGVVIYPSKYVAGGEKEITSDSFAIHQCEHSWYDFSKYELFKKFIKKIIKGFMSCKNN